MAAMTKRATVEGIGFGVVAGVVFALGEILVSVIRGDAWLAPLRLISSTVLGREALDGTPVATALLVGLLVHLVLSAGFGFMYGLLNALFSEATHTNWGLQAALGVVFGLVLWVGNFQVIARAYYPWFLDTPQFIQLVLHAALFGVPLALLYAAGERRGQHLAGTPTPA